MKKTPTKKRVIGDDPPDPYLVAFGQKVEATRKRLNMTVKTMSELAEMSDVSCWLLENGQRNPTLLSVLKIAKAFNTTPQALMPDQDETFWSNAALIGQEDIETKFRDTTDLLAQCSDRLYKLLISLQAATVAPAIPSAGAQTLPIAKSGPRKTKPAPGPVPKVSVQGKQKATSSGTSR